MYRSERLELRMSAGDLALLDRLRGTTTRSAYIRNLLIRAEKVSTNPPQALSPGGDHDHRWVGKIGGQHCDMCGVQR